MSSIDDASMEEILLEDDERDSIEYKILMAYAQRRLSVSKYGKLLQNEANVQRSSLIRRKEKLDHQRDKDGPSLRAVYEGGTIQQHRGKQRERKHWLGYGLHFLFSKAKKKMSPGLPLPPECAARSSIFEAQSADLPEGNSEQQTRLAHWNLERTLKSALVLESEPDEDLDTDTTTLTGETADVNQIADKLAKLVTSRSQQSPSDVSFKATCPVLCQSEGRSRLIDETEDEEKIIQNIVALLKESGDQLEEKMEKDTVFYKHFKDMLSYTFFKRITDLFLEDVSAGSTSEPGDQVQCMKVAFTMEIITRLTAMDNHPMNLVLGFGLMYLREHFKLWIQDQGGWEKALTSLDQEEVE
ncbi:apoptosis facilitator Bcl-2-like protein 14 [Podargus strigoides]